MWLSIFSLRPSPFLLDQLGSTETDLFKLVRFGPVFEDTSVQSGLENSMTEVVGPVQKHGERSGWPDREHPYIYIINNLLNWDAVK